MANWESILKWSLQHHDGTTDVPQMDEERRQWLEEALEAISSSPTESQLLQTAITVLRAHMPEKEGKGGGMEEGEERNLLKAFEETRYLIEDLDHANDLIPMEGVDVIASYLHHHKPSLVQCACELVATASQNNHKTQQAFLQTLPHLLTILNNRDLPSSVHVKALYAVSCLTRGSSAGIRDLLSLDGLAPIRQCLGSEERRLVVKALFLLSSYFSSDTVQGEVKDKLDSKLPSLVPELVSLVRTGTDQEVKGHALSALVTMVTHHEVAVRECRREEVGLRQLLSELSVSQDHMHEEELTHVRAIKEICFS